MIRAALIATLALGAAVAGCGGSDSAATNKAGAPVTDAPQVIVVEDPAASRVESNYFAERVAARSRGTLRVEIRQSYPSALPANEARLARLVRAGDVDVGFVQGRAWPSAGAPAFAALQAPFVLGDYDVARQAIAGPAGAALEDSLERAGVVPLAVVPIGLRRVLSAKPLVSRSNFRDQRIRIYDNDTAAADLRALGAEPVQGIDADGVVERLEGGRLDGVETGPGGALNFEFWRGARHFTAYALFSAFETIVVSPDAWKRLSASQQAALSAAAKDTVGLGRTLAEREAALLEELCRGGVRVGTPSAAQLQGLADATEPVRTALKDDPATASVMRLLEGTPGAGPRVLATPNGCSVAAPGGGQDTAGSATIPNGVYVTRTTAEDYGPGYTWEADAYTWTTRLRDGKWSRTVVPRFPDQVGDVDGAGFYEVHSNQVTFHYTKPYVDAEIPEVLRWSYYDGRLTFEIVHVNDNGARGIYTARPWKKVR